MPRTVAPSRPADMLVVSPADRDTLQYEWYLRKHHPSGRLDVVRMFNGQFICLARLILSRKIGRGLVPKDRVVCLDGNPQNLARDNLTLLGELKHPPRLRVDDEDLDLLLENWCLDPRGTVYRRSGGHAFYLARVILARKLKGTPKDRDVVVYLDGDKQNLTRDNLGLRSERIKDRVRARLARAETKRKEARHWRFVPGYNGYPSYFQGYLSHAGMKFHHCDGDSVDLVMDFVRGLQEIFGHAPERDPVREQTLAEHTRTIQTSPEYQPGPLPEDEETLDEHPE